MSGTLWESLLKILTGLSVDLFGTPATKSYDPVIKYSGISIKPEKFLSLTHLITGLLFLFSILIPFFYLLAFKSINLVVLIPTAVLLLIFLLEAFEFYIISPAILLAQTLTSIHSWQVEQQVPYALLFMNQLMSIGVPYELARKKLSELPEMQFLNSSLEKDDVQSDSLQEFKMFLQQCEKVGVTPQILADLETLSSTYRESALVRLRSLGNLANQLFTYILALYTASIVVIVLAGMGISFLPGIEFLLLDIINPLLFAAGVLYLIGGRK